MGLFGFENKSNEDSFANQQKSEESMETKRTKEDAQ